jgi:hypothetical protein
MTLGCLLAMAIWGYTLTRFLEKMYLGLLLKKPKLETEAVILGRD